MGDLAEQIDLVGGAQVVQRRGGGRAVIDNHRSIVDQYIERGAGCLQLRYRCSDAVGIGDIQRQHVHVVWSAQLAACGFATCRVAAAQVHGPAGVGEVGDQRKANAFVGASDQCNRCGSGHAGSSLESRRSPPRLGVIPQCVHSHS